ncbi:outer membrane protein assembly factor BamE [Poseidonocella sp. HB161398]|uniref:outer membrane protein assembly factor BamE n=1 Tax=Poseidonocella sp. HB161398 TaxID=2320855 RepID=UPI00110867EB|nr:outer membrane protein assembly factor BamE [Poseidonocella sp. HB161398]
MTVARIKTAMLGAGLAMALAAISGCTTMVDNYGYVPTDMQLEEVQLGDTRDAVTEKIGQPPLEDFRRDNVWYFVASKTETYGWKAPVTVERQVVAVRFTDNGTVSNVERFGLADGEVVTLSRRVTESAVPDIGFLKGLLSSTSLRPAMPTEDSL